MYRNHYRNPRLCREQDPLGIGLIALGTACAERELSAERSRHRWAGKDGSAESHTTVNARFANSAKLLAKTL
jgi:hypothetical protein